MAPPGSLSARYERLAGAEDQRLELYIARSKLGFSIDEWKGMPWWHRRVYVEGMEWEAEQTARAAQGGSEGLNGSSAFNDPAEALLGGTMGDLAALGYKTT